MYCHCVRYGEFGGPKTGVRVHSLLQLLHSPIPLSLPLSALASGGHEVVPSDHYYRAINGQAQALVAAVCICFVHAPKTVRLSAPLFKGL